MLAVSERVKHYPEPDEVIWHKPIGPDPDAMFQRIACSDTDGIVMRGPKLDVPLKLDRPGEWWCPDCIANTRR